MSDVDIAIITIIREEYVAIVKRLRGARPPEASETDANLYAWTLGEIKHKESGRSFRVVVAMATDPGTTSGALVTQSTIRRWNPRYVLIVGIAGGFNPRGQISENEKLNLGDVLLSAAIWGYEYGKIAKKFKPRLDWTFHVDRGLLPSAIAFAELDKSWMRPKSIGLDYYLTGMLKRPPHVVAGPIASGDKVIDNPTQQFFAEVIKTWPKLRGVEMEGAGAAAAIEMAQAEGRSIGFLMIRGISDLPRVEDNSGSNSRAVAEGQSERDRWKLFAANAAAAFTIALIAKRWPLAPRSEYVSSAADGSSGGKPAEDGSQDTPKPGKKDRDRGVLFYQADLEMLENSKVLRSRISRTKIANALKLEFRLLFLAIPTDAYLVIPPSYYLESEFCRELLQQHVILIEAGYVRLSIDYPDFKDYIEVKRERYAKARHVPRFELAYFSRKTYGIKNLPFRFTSKTKSVGRRTLDLWDEQLKSRATEIDFPTHKMDEFRKRALETEKSAILYDNLIEHMDRVGLTESDARILRIREIMNSNYLRAYDENGIRIPTGSLVIWDGLTRHVSHTTYHIEDWLRIFESFALIKLIMKFSPEQLLIAKLLPEINVFLEDIRTSIEANRRTDQITSRLRKLGMVETIRRHFRNISRLSD